MKSQSESLSKEYDRLCDERVQMEKKLRIAGGGGDGDAHDKKDD